MYKRANSPVDCDINKQVIALYVVFGALYDFVMPRDAVVPTEPILQSEIAVGNGRSEGSEARQ